ncbi:class I SAM-dependent methyltransferase [Iningainema tapete]|uniref:Class I SAM-dependent methyltransferase n=1 Tax=Iningainema tapete BLCC-T55 TaxID=2748662 RepID=A0A8J6XE69_9CYAN|nr:class I SAM-dependent methyltransferase [Iningainema tapete]MBD2774695.1 class I SAM-dependent methyltransferase [Iningainema tapete BLCC-T55]
MICYCCGSSNLKSQDVLWQELIDEWRIARYEVEYINRQQGLHCLECYSNLRSMALAVSIMRCFGYKGLFKDFVKQPKIQDLQILEINEAGSLTQFLSGIPGHTLKVYPDIDMMNINLADTSFDLVVHSDVLEHIQHPIRGLSECYRVLKPGGFCAFTIPMIVDRLTVYRAGLPPSYHGSKENKSDFLVHTEYGCDAWKHVIQAGFQECRIFSLEYPSAQAFVAVK